MRNKTDDSFNNKRTLVNRVKKICLDIYLDKKDNLMQFYPDRVNILIKFKR